MNIHMKKLCFILSLWGIVFLFSQCKKETDQPLLPPRGDVESWVKMANEDIQSLATIVKAIEEDDPILRVTEEEELLKIDFSSGAKASIRLDNSNYPGPLVGAHLIDANYYWTVVNGTGTSAVRLLKDQQRRNYAIKDEITPELGVNSTGNWTVAVEGIQEELFDAEGNPFRAIGRKSLFNSVSFDIDSNATVVTNESAGKAYVIPRDRPFTFLLDRSKKDTLTIASGFAIAVDFQQVGIDEIAFELPRAWSASYELHTEQKSGVLYINSPLGIEPEFDEKGMIRILAKDQHGRSLERKIPVKVEVGVVNYASVRLTDLADGVEITGATFTFTEDVASTNTRDVTAIKAGDSFRLMLPDGFPELRKISFITTQGGFDYFFAPQTMLNVGEQNLSIAPPQLKSYWQGGIIVQINETLPLTGIAAYQISGKVVHVQSPTANRNWFPNGNVNVSAANSDTDGAANTTAIISALGGPGTSDNFIARWAIRVRDGGYSDWYLGAQRDYEYFHNAWLPFLPNSAEGAKAINQIIANYGGNIKLRDTHNLFWTSTNISATHAKAYDVRYNPPYTTGQKIYGARGLAFRDFN